MVENAEGRGRVDDHRLALRPPAVLRPELHEQPVVVAKD